MSAGAHRQRYRPVPDAAGEARRLFLAAHQLTQGGDFSARVCAEAVPLLRASLEQWEKVPAAARDDVYPRLQLGRCEITQGEHALAAGRLRQLLDAPLAPGNALLASEARIDLGDLYGAWPGGCTGSGKGTRPLSAGPTAYLAGASAPRPGGGRTGL